jgi:hypothetical protein
MRACRRGAADRAVRVDDAGEVQLGDRLDDPRAADAGDTGASDLVGEPGSSDQDSQPIT